MASTTKRPDVAAKKAARQQVVSSVVKLTLNQFCKPLAQSIPWHRLVKVLSHVALEAKLLANYHVLRLLENGLPLPVLDQSFYSSCCAVVGSVARELYALSWCLVAFCTRVSAVDLTCHVFCSFTGESVLSAELRTTFAMYKTWRRPHSQPPNTAYLASGALNNLARTLKTELGNHLAANFFSKFKQYLRARHGLKPDQAHAVLRQIYGFDDQVETAGQHQRTSEFVVLYWKQRLPDGNIPSKVNLQRDPAAFLPMFHEFQKFLHSTADFSELKKIKRFSLLPHKAGFKASFFRVDTDTLHGLLQASLVRTNAVSLSSVHKPHYFYQACHSAGGRL